MNINKKSSIKHDWYEEFQYDYLKVRYKIKEVLFSAKSDYQEIEIIDTNFFGKILLNDGIVMLSEQDEFVYHEMIAHVPLFIHPNPQKVLVIGGGDGGTVREIIRHKEVELCHLVEIDEMVVNACKEHIPQTSAALNDPRVKVMICDGVKYVKETDERYDLIIVDSTDPIGPATPLFGKDFYTDVNNILNNPGIVISQAETPFYHLDMQKGLLNSLKPSFNKRFLYGYSNLLYPSGYWTFSFATNSLCPIKDFNRDKFAQTNLKFKWYNKNIHKAAFALPQFVKDELSEYLTEVEL